MQSGQTKYGIGMTVSACLWLGLFPLMQFGTFSTITRDKWICMFILTGVSVICFLTDLFCRHISRPRLVPLIAGGALLLWMLLSDAFSPYTDPDNLFASAWWIGAGRREGLATQICYLALFFLFSFSRVNRKPVLLSAAAGVFVFLVVVLLQRAGGNPFGLYPGSLNFANSSHFQGTIGHVDMCAGYLLIAAGLFLPAIVRLLRSLYCFRKQENLSGEDPQWKLILPACVFLLAFLACVYLILTMDVELGMLTLLVLLAWTFVRLFPAKIRLPILVLLLVLVLVVVWFWPAEGGGAVWELHEVLRGRPQIMFGSGRIGIWTYTFRMLQEELRPVFGSGTDTFARRFNTFLGKYYTAHPEAERLIEYFDNPHCDYLVMLVNCGIPALLFFLVLVLGGCFGLPAWRDSVLCYGIQILLSFSVCIVAPMFWVVLGMSWSMPSSGKRKKRRETRVFSYT